MASKPIVGRKRHTSAPAMTAAQVQEAGVRSAHSTVRGQQKLPMDLGPQEAAHERHGEPLRSWESLSLEQRERTSSTLRNTYGVTMDNAIRNHGALIDRAVRAGAKGQNFYAGRGTDDESAVGRDATIGLARKHDIPVHVAASVRAVMSPRSNVHDELLNADRVIAHAKANPHDDSIPSDLIGLGGPRNAVNGAALMRGHLRGEHPIDVTRPSGASGRQKQVLDEKTMPKVRSYLQGYLHPESARATIDTHAVAGMAPHLPKSSPRAPTGKVDAKGKPFTTPVAKGHPDWVPNQEDALGVAGAYEFFSHAAKVAAERRGLAPSEAQSLAWHVERTRGGNVQPGTGNARSRRPAGNSPRSLF